jgi:hypothetical protein
MGLTGCEDDLYNGVGSHHRKLVRGAREPAASACDAGNLERLSDGGSRSSGDLISVQCGPVSAAQRCVSETSLRKITGVHFRNHVAVKPV